MSTKCGLAKRLVGTEKNVWVEFGKLATEYDAVNLGQGFPDFFPPTHVTDALKQVINTDKPLLNQYTRSFGHPRLVNALAKLFSPIMGKEINPLSDILVTLGGYGSLYCAIHGYLNPGDEAIIVEPFFDCYEPMVRTAGGAPVFMPLRPTKQGPMLSSDDWKLDPAELSSKFNKKTKLFIFNTPNNPLGKVFDQSELEMIADLCIKYDVLCISDEVYEWLVFDDKKHIKIATLPGMWDRTLTIGSAGKTFSVTGWKIGWTIAPSDLLFPPKVLHQNSSYTCATPIQEAIALAIEYEMKRLETPECYFSALAKTIKPKRDRLAKMLLEFGMIPIIPSGGYFMMADISQLKVTIPDDETDDPYDFKFVRWMTRVKKLSAIPPTAFYSKEHRHLAEKYIRLCFIKEDSTLEKAAKILREWKSSF